MGDLSAKFVLACCVPEEDHAVADVGEALVVGLVVEHDAVALAGLAFFALEDGETVLGYEGAVFPGGSFFVLEDAYALTGHEGDHDDGDEGDGCEADAVFFACPLAFVVVSAHDIMGCLAANLRKNAVLIKKCCIFVANYRNNIYCICVKEEFVCVLHLVLRDRYISAVCVRRCIIICLRNSMGGI